MKQEPFKPDYNNSILNLMSSILKNYGVKNNYSSLKKLDQILTKKYTNIVLLVLDGMGENVLKKASPDGIFSTHKLSTITSIYPCTTTAALTTYYTAKPPIETGWLAWSQYFKEYGRAVDMLPYIDSYTGEKISRDKFDVYNCLKYKTVYEQISEASNSQVYEIKPTYCDPKTDKCIHIKSIDSMCTSIETLCKSNEQKYIFSYFDNPDGINHKYGWDSKESKEFILYSEECIKKLIENLQGTNTLLIISADHGHNNINKNYNILDLDTLKDCFIMPPSFEPRFVSFWIKNDKKKYFVKEFNKLFLNEFLLFSKEEFMNSNLLGYGQKHPKIDDFIGDYIAIGISNSAINLGTYISRDVPIKLSNHCGLTKNELEVPLIVFELK